MLWQQGQRSICVNVKILPPHVVFQQDNTHLHIVRRTMNFLLWNVHSHHTSDSLLLLIHEV